MRIPPRIWLRIWLPLVLLAVWEISARGGFLNPIFFPPPSTLLTTGFAMIQSGELPMQLGITVARTLEGAAIGILVGSGCGILMGSSRAIRQSLEPLVAALNSTPKLALLPLLMLFLGIGEAPRLVLISAAAFVTATLPMLDAVRNLDSNYVELARNYGAHSWQLVRWVYLPGCLPHLLTAVRLALSRALSMCIGIEIVNSQSGLGNIIWAGWLTLTPERVYVGVFTAGALGLLFHVSMRLIEKVLVPWKVHPVIK
jgi:ABC-type nitrate/sulfonate/bicarbonate transport system permease component